MSRSWRRPYTAITGAASAKADKRLANRSVRHKQSLILKTCSDYESLVLPHRLECAWNNRYCWGRDGTQRYMDSWYEADDEHARRYYLKLLRK